LADDCLWGLAPQSSPSPICAAYPSSAFSEYWEPRLPAKSSRSGCCNACLRPAIRPTEVRTSTGTIRRVDLNIIAVIDEPVVRIFEHFGAQPQQIDSKTSTTLSP
jgi:hypothetical protein